MSENDGGNDRVATCRICGGPALSCFTAKEMMFGRHEDFAYLECQSRGCVQISEYPENIADYYPLGYYSYENSIAPDPKTSGGMLKAISKFSKRTLMRIISTPKAVSGFCPSRLDLMYASLNMIPPDFSSGALSCTSAAYP